MLRLVFSRTDSLAFIFLEGGGWEEKGEKGDGGELI